MRLLNQERRIIIVLNCNFVSCSEATKSSEVVNTAEAFNTVPTEKIIVIFYATAQFLQLPEQHCGLFLAFGSMF